MSVGSMNRLWHALILVLFQTLTLTMGVHADQSPAVPPEIRFESDHVNLGEVLEGDILNGVFEFWNTGGSPLRIQKVKPGVGVSIVSHTTEVPPGEKGDIRVRIDTAGAAREFTCKIAVHSNAPASPVTMLKAVARITPLLSLKPDRIFLTGLAGTHLEQQVEVTWRGEGNVAVSIDSSDVADHARAAIQTITPGRRYLMKVENLMTSPGAYRGRLMLATDRPGKERIVVPVQGRILPAIEAYPRTLLLHPGRCPGCRERRGYIANITVRSHDDTPFHIEAVKTPVEGLETRLETLIRDRAYRVLISGEVRNAVPLDTELLILTDRKGYEVLTVPVSFRSPE